MKHHQYNLTYDFVKEPTHFNKYTDVQLLKYCLGATLYMPATKVIIEKIASKSLEGLTTMVMCFEDAIADHDLQKAEKNVLDHLDLLTELINNDKLVLDDIPLIFLRTRSVEQFAHFLTRLKPSHTKVLTGFVFPKVDESSLQAYFEMLQDLNRSREDILYGMPIIEGKKIALHETRIPELQAIKNVLDSYNRYVINVRVGSNDLSAIFGVRRGINYTIYDIISVRDCLADILNLFTREGENYIVSAPVWEYFLADKKESIDRLLEYDIHTSLLKRTPVVNEAVDGLLREVVLDKANGFVGKTIIHPSHLKYVNAMQAVTAEEYNDASQVLQMTGGVAKGSNKMNEASPHRNWAEKTIMRAKAYGVVKNEASYYRLFSG